LESQNTNIRPEQREQLVSPSKLQSARRIDDSESKEAANPNQGASSGVRSGPSQLDPFGDRERTELRYKTAVTKFEQAFESRRASWKSFEAPTFQNFEGDTIPNLQEQLQKMLLTRQRPTVEDKDFWSKGKAIIEKTFKALSPLAKNLLVVANGVTSVRPLVVTRL